MCAPLAPLWPPCPAVVQLKLSHASLEVQKQLAEQQCEEALATVSVLEGQLADIGAEIATHMQVGLVVLHSPAWGAWTTGSRVAGSTGSTVSQGANRRFVCRNQL